MSRVQGTEDGIDEETDCGTDTWPLRKQNEGGRNQACTFYNNISSGLQGSPRVRVNMSYYQ